MKRLLALFAVLLLGAGLAGCGGDDDDDAATDTTAAETTTTTEAAVEETTTTAAADPDAEALVLDATETAAGTVLSVDGMTVYLFTLDQAGAETACADDCASAWPPLFAEGGVRAGAGADGALLGSAPRDDGPGDQVTYNGHRLYFFSGDAAPGDSNGQGVGDVWFAVTPEGEPAAS